MDNVALFFHLVGVLLFAAGVATVGISFELARRRKQLSEIAVLLSVTRIGALLVAFGAPVIGVFGLWLVHLDHFSYGSGWVSASIALYAVGLVLGGLGGQRPKRARQLANRLLLDRDEITDELRGLLDDRLSRAANYSSSLVVLAVFVLMVFKP